MTVIQARGLVKRYPGMSTPVLRDIDVSVDAGETLWVSGPSGCGKSTLLNVLGLLAAPDAGTYTVAGVETTRASASLRRRLRQRSISTVFQRGNLFDHLSAIDNVLVGMADPDQALAAETLAEVGLTAAMNRQAGLLSGGEQIRVAFARAAARRTPVLLADEPLAGLDDDAARSVLSAISRVVLAGACVVLVSHDERAHSIADTRQSLKEAA